MTGKDLIHMYVHSVFVITYNNQYAEYYITDELEKVLWQMIENDLSGIDLYEFLETEYDKYDLRFYFSYIEHEQSAEWNEQRTPYVCFLINLETYEISIDTGFD